MSERHRFLIIRQLQPPASAPERRSGSPVAVRMTYFWAWFNVLTMGLDDGEMERETFDEIEINGKINGEVDGEIVRLRHDPARSLAALKVRGRLMFSLALA